MAPLFLFVALCQDSLCESVRVSVEKQYTQAEAKQCYAEAEDRYTELLAKSRFAIDVQCLTQQKFEKYGVRFKK